MSVALSSEPPAMSGPVAVIVNKRELARALNVALPTIAGYLDRYDDFLSFRKANKAASGNSIFRQW